jgi:hypothetical protein
VYGFDIMLHRASVIMLKALGSLAPWKATEPTGDLGDFSLESCLPLKPRVQEHELIAALEAVPLHKEVRITCQGHSAAPEP